MSPMTAPGPIPACSHISASVARARSAIIVYRRISASESANAYSLMYRSLPRAVFGFIIGRRPERGGDFSLRQANRARALGALGALGVLGVLGALGALAGRSGTMFLGVTECSRRGFAPPPTVFRAEVPN